MERKFASHVLKKMKTLRFFVLIVSFLILLFISFYDLRGVSYNFGKNSSYHNYKLEESFVGRAVYFFLEKTVLKKRTYYFCWSDNPLLGAWEVSGKHVSCGTSTILGNLITPTEADKNYPRRRLITKIFLIMFLISTFGAICVSKFRFIVSKKIIDIWKGI